MIESIANTGKVAPQAENPTTPHRELILIDMRNDGAIPKANTPKPWAATTVKKARSIITFKPPGCGKQRCPYKYHIYPIIMEKKITN